MTDFFFAAFYMLAGWFVWWVPSLVVQHVSGKCQRCGQEVTE